MLDSCVCNLCSTYLCALSMEVSSSISWRVVSSTSIMSLTCFMAWMTVAWLRLPMLAPTWTCDLPVSSEARYMAICRALAICCVRVRESSWLTLRLYMLQTHCLTSSMVMVCSSLTT